jgi:hypothetical protein
MFAAFIDDSETDVLAHMDFPFSSGSRSTVPARPIERHHNVPGVVQPVW